MAGGPTAACGPPSACCHPEGAPALVLPKRTTAGARQKDLAVERPVLAVTRAMREEPRSTGRTVAEPNSSVGATGFHAIGEDRAGASLRMTGDPLLMTGGFAACRLPIPRLSS
jgi:hypothetical protein